MIAFADGVTKTKLARPATLWLAVALCIVGTGQGRAEPSASPPIAQRAPPVENWRKSPFHGVTDGAGRVIPCRCRYQGRAYRLGERVCMQTPRGTALARCDLYLNNTSWIPSSDPCTISGLSGSASLASQ